jgi:hypothetical protein
MNKLLVILFCVILVGCGVKKVNSVKKNGLPGLPEKIQLGLTSSEAAKSELGNPSNVFNSNDHQKTLIYSYNGIGTLNFENNVLKAFFREPIKEEIYLQYWQQRWKNKKIAKVKMETMPTSHESIAYELICKEEKTIVIYNDDNGLVKRVVHYED